MKAGFGSAPITPTPPVNLAGFGDRTEPVTEVHDELEARALYLSEGDVVLCLVVCDLLGMSAGFSRPVREAIAGALGIVVAVVLLACTHTHQGPSCIAGSEAIGWPTPPGYLDVLQDGCIAAAVASQAAATDATLHYGRAPLPDGFAFNRRAGAYDDPELAVLDVRTPDGAKAGERIGVVANLGIHPVLLGPIWRAVSTDWVGPFRTELERLAGGTAIELTGALGDINPTPPKQVENTYDVWATAEETDEYGKRLAAVVAAALEGAQPLDDTLAILRADTMDIDVGGTAIAMLHGEPTMKVEFVEWSIGDVRVVGIPGEGFHLLGQQIAASRGGRVLLAGLAPSWHGYLPEPWGDGYEEGVSFGPDFVATVKNELLRRR
jgi:hypothetical protein